MGYLEYFILQSIFSKLYNNFLLLFNFFYEYLMRSHTKTTMNQTYRSKQSNHKCVAMCPFRFDLARTITVIIATKGVCKNFYC